MVDGFLLGVIATASITAGMFFLRFWRDTRDSFFLAFAAAFIIEGLNRAGLLLVLHPNEGTIITHLVRLFSSLLILGAIFKKNFGSKK